MSRDLKNEYEAMLDQEIPDLWSRIEPRLAEKTGKSRMSQTAGVQTARQKKSTRRRLKRSTIAVWGSLAAAGVCLAIILPAWRGSDKGSDRSNQMLTYDQEASDVSADETVKGGSLPTQDNSMSPEMEPESSIADDGSADDSFMNFDAGSDGALNAQESVTEEAAEAAGDGDAYENDTAQSPQENNTERAEAPDETETDRNEDASESWTVYECRGEIVDVWRTLDGFFYRMELTEDAEAFMPAGSEIVILQKAGLFTEPNGTKDAVLMNGHSYRITVEPEDADGEIRYVLISYEADEAQ